MSRVSGELIDFVLPKLSDPLQVGFLLIILLMMAYTIISAHLAARPASWEKKWNRGTRDKLDDDLDIEHGSVTDLWHAVATSSEKLAEVMPGMLLVVGLLGTFLGLGMALNHASNILGQSNAIADGMGDMLAMLQGLGTKFKTSTWGIMGFVLLKIWSEATRFDEKRLTWVIDKVKVELEGRKKEQIEVEKKKQQALFEQISNTSAYIVEGVRAALAQSDNVSLMSLGEIKGVLLSTIEQGKAHHSQHIDQLGAVATQIAGQIKEALAQSDSDQQRLFGITHENLASIHRESKASSDAMSSFTQGTQGIVQRMADAAQGMVSGSDKVSSAAEGLENVVKEFGSEFKVVLDGVRKDLGAAIGKMSKDSAATLKEGSEKLEGATKEISGALKVLSSDVTATMTQVKDSIGDALAIQRKSANEFTLSAQTLNENIEVTTNNAKVLGKEINQGLASVAGASRQMNQIGKSLVEITGKDGLAAIPDAIRKLNDIEMLLRKQVAALERVADVIDRAPSDLSRSNLVASESAA